jgi:hypothetical protein
MPRRLTINYQPFTEQWSPLKQHLHSRGVIVTLGLFKKKSGITGSPSMTSRPALLILLDFRASINASVLTTDPRDEFRKNTPSDISHVLPMPEDLHRSHLPFIMANSSLSIMWYVSFVPGHKHETTSDVRKSSSFVTYLTPSSLSISLESCVRLL